MCAFADKDSQGMYRQENALISMSVQIQNDKLAE